jgi:hypothetical protein
MKRILLIGFVLAGCGSSASSIDAAAPDTSGGIHITTSAFADGNPIPAVHTCSGANTSPPLGWSGAPSGTQSFAVVLTDLSLSPVLVHWVIYDIPGTAIGLTPGVENVYAPTNVTGAHQTASVHAGVVGYYGPCPMMSHNYEFAVYALDVATLPGGSAATTRPEAVAQIQTHQLARGTLNGTYSPP